MPNFNHAVIAGHLTRDPELRYTPGGAAVANITLAVNDRVKKGEQWIDEVSFFECVLWQRSAEVANEYLTKGSPCLISGRLKQESWEDKSGGGKRSKIVLVCDKLQLLGSKGDRSAPRGPDPTLAEFATSGVEDEPPF